MNKGERKEQSSRTRICLPKIALNVNGVNFKLKDTG
jgi:hypothetical protein